MQTNPGERVAVEVVEKFPVFDQIQAVGIVVLVIAALFFLARQYLQQRGGNDVVSQAFALLGDMTHNLHRLVDELAELRESVAELHSCIDQLKRQSRER